ncbi:hypothetical protein HW555_005892 [Spodoptera exigua]|uniref:Uncharacterized protein n=1 Tax=Spodoptera exigua TaxID=7107 RepID=A0A835GJA0_SPOEX|nr:hypothetical protein HW555_005892 [Spodoptera exigua]
MAKILFLIFVSWASVAFALEAEKFSCDYQFGDPTWNFTKVYYDKGHTLPKGSKHAQTLLPVEEGYMISFVCVNIPGVNKTTTQVAFSSLHHKVSIELAQRANTDVPYHILAKRHGY